MFVSLIIQYWLSFVDLQEFISGVYHYEMHRHFVLMENKDGGRREPEGF